MPGGEALPALPSCDVVYRDSWIVGGYPPFVSSRPCFYHSWHHRALETMFCVAISAALLIVARFARAQDQDQINNFCRRFGHRTTVIDNNFYIDG